MNAISTITAWLPRRTGGLVLRSSGKAQNVGIALRFAAHSPTQRAVEAADVRALARRYMDSDPGFAADLLAAADRHETSDPITAKP